MLSLRIIHSNGTVDEKDIKLEEIQQLNYCIYHELSEPYFNYLL